MVGEKNGKPQNNGTVVPLSEFEKELDKLIHEYADVLLAPLEAFVKDDDSVVLTSQASFFYGQELTKRLGMRGRKIEPTPIQIIQGGNLRIYQENVKGKKVIVTLIPEERLYLYLLPKRLRDKGVKETMFTFTNPPRIVEIEPEIKLTYHEAVRLSASPSYMEIVIPPFCEKVYEFVKKLNGGKAKVTLLSIGTSGTVVTENVYNYLRNMNVDVKKATLETIDKIVDGKKVKMIYKPPIQEILKNEPSLLEGRFVIGVDDDRWSGSNEGAFHDWMKEFGPKYNVLGSTFAAPMVLVDESGKPPIELYVDVVRDDKPIVKLTGNVNTTKPK